MLKQIRQTIYRLQDWVIQQLEVVKCWLVFVFHRYSRAKLYGPLEIKTTSPLKLQVWSEIAVFSV